MSPDDRHGKKVLAQHCPNATITYRATYRIGPVLHLEAIYTGLTILRCQICTILLREFLSNLVSAGTVAACITLAGGFLIQRLGSRIQTSAALLSERLSRGTFAYQDNYKREQDLYRKIWPPVGDLIRELQHGEFVLKDRVMPIDAERRQKLWERLAKNIDSAFIEIENNRPFIPPSIVALCDEISAKTADFTNEVLAPLDEFLGRNPPSAKEIAVLATRLEQSIRARSEWLLEPGAGEVPASARPPRRWLRVRFQRPTQNVG